MDANPFLPHDVIATFPDMERARRAVQALQLAGVEAASIELFGAPAEEAAADRGTREADERFARTMWRRTWIGGLLGTIAGAVLGGAAAAWALRDVGGGEAVALVWAGVAGTAVLGMGAGAATGATSSAQMSRAWELTFHTVGPGQVGVSVHTDRDSEARRALAVLARCSPTQVDRLDIQ